MARHLTSNEIERLASRKGAKRIAVENFLGTLPTDLPMGANIANMEMDARLYGWNAITQKAIRDGIYKAYSSQLRIKNILKRTKWVFRI